MRRPLSKNVLFDSGLLLCLSFSGERRKLYHLAQARHVSGLCALAIDALARDGERVMQVVQLFRFQMNRLLATPAESISPGRITQRHARRSVLALFQEDFDSLIFARGW